MPLSTRIRRLPSSISRQRRPQFHKLCSSAGLVLLHNVLGTTPNMAPPSSLKKPVLITCNFIVRITNLLRIYESVCTDNEQKRILPMQITVFTPKLQHRCYTFTNLCETF